MYTLEEKVGQLLMVGFHGLEAPDYILEWLADGRIGGVYFFSRNVDTPEQVAALAKSCHNAAKYPILIGIDQEGGLVARLRDGFTESPGAMALSATDDTQLVEDVSAMMAREMRALGINWVFAPVADITHNINNPSVGTRSLGTDKAHVSRMIAAEVRGFQREGVAACAKHFPGLGNTPIDTHEELAVIHGSVDYLSEHDLVPFRSAIDNGTATVMITHVKFEALDADYPATLSPAICRDLLREKMGFTGIIATDCMEMKAITNHYGAGESAVLSVLAEVDLQLFSHTRHYQEEVYDALLTAAKSGRISEARLDESLARIEKLKQQYALSELISTEVIRHPDHLELAKKAARAGIALIQSTADFPLSIEASQAIGLVEFASHNITDAMEGNEQSDFGTLLKQHIPNLKVVTLKSYTPQKSSIEHAKDITNSCDVLVLVTRNAHLLAEQQVIAQTLIDTASQTILVCLRNPYDVSVLSGADTILCTHGDSTPSVEAAVDALIGKFFPSGKTPVPL